VKKTKKLGENNAQFLYGKNNKIVLIQISFFYVFILKGQYN